MTKRKFGLFDIRWHEVLGNPDCPSAYRYALIALGYGIRIHHWLKSDDERASHDHPWWMIIVPLRGGYIDHRPDSDEVVGAGVYFRPAEYRHWVEIKSECWTLVVTGPKVREHGFWKDGKLFRPLTWFKKYGHHACIDNPKGE